MSGAPYPRTLLAEFAFGSDHPLFVKFRIGLGALTIIEQKMIDWFQENPELASAVQGYIAEAERDLSRAARFMQEAQAWMARGESAAARLKIN